MGCHCFLPFIILGDLVLLGLVIAYIITHKSAIAIKLKMKPMKDKLVIVIGGSKGIGLGIAKICYKLGANIIICARNPEALDSAKALIRAEIEEEKAPKKSSKPQFVDSAILDATDIAKCEAVIDSFVAKYGAPDYLINCVGGAAPSTFLGTSIELFHKSMEFNYFGQLNPTYAALKHMLAAHKGKIVFTSSLAGFIGVTGYSTYAPPKHALIGLARTLRNEITGSGVQVAVAMPPDTDTDGFRFENEHKTKDTAHLSRIGGLHTVDRTAHMMVSGMMCSLIFYITSVRGWALWRAFRMLPNVAMCCQDKIVQRSRARESEKKED